MSTRLAGVIGWHAGRSLSPRLHGYWLREYGIDGGYVPLRTRREDLTPVIDGLRRAGFAGVNVTIPHKQAAFALSHDLDDAARAARAVNLLLFKDDGRIAGRNTDAAGLAASLAHGLGDQAVRGKRAVLIGAGGAARAAILALAALGVADIHILARNADRGADLAHEFGSRVSPQITPVLWSNWEEAAEGAALVVNATSAGMAGNAALDLSLDPLPKDAAVCDIVYNPLETPLLKAARARGALCIDGLGMLMHQAVPAFAEFYGVTPAVTPALRAELEKALRHG